MRGELSGVKVESVKMECEEEEVKTKAESRLEASQRHSQRPKVPRKVSLPGEPTAESGPGRSRRVRCMQCPACLQMTDCGKCVHCK